MIPAKRGIPINDAYVDENLRLTKYSELRGCGCKVPQDLMQKLFDNTPNVGQQLGHRSGEEQLPMPLFMQLTPGAADTSVTPLKHGGLSMIQAADFSYPIVDDAYTMGRIGCANVLSKLYAMGIVDCDNMLMLFTLSTKLPEKDREKVASTIMAGFRDCAAEAGTVVTGGQTVLNPWLSIGGVATAVSLPNEFVMPNSSLPGDVLVLTKPLGSQVAVSVYQWLSSGSDKWTKLKQAISEDEARKAYYRAVDSMARLNRTAARLMHKYNAHAAIDVGGYGLYGHACNLAKAQRNEVAFVIHNLPIISRMAGVLRQMQPPLFNLLGGTAPETSGGLLIVLPREQAASFCKDVERTEGYQAWIVGIVEKAQNPNVRGTCRIIEKPRVIEVPAREREGELW